MNAFEPMRQRVLIVDDDRSVMTILAELVERFGYVADIAASGNEALSIIDSAAYTPELAIVDVALANENGADVARSLIDRAPKMRVLLISGYADAIIDIGTPPEKKRTFFLRKPFSPEQLKRALEIMSGS